MTSGIAERIRSARLNLKMSQTGLAEATGKSRGAVAQWENGTIEPRRDTVEAIAAALQVSPVWLETGEDVRYIGIPVVDQIGHGIWKDSEATFDRRVIRIAKNLDFPGEKQVLYQLTDASADRIAMKGDLLHAVLFDDFESQMMSGDVVIVARTEMNLTELTARRLFMRGRDFRLAGLSKTLDLPDTTWLDSPPSGLKLVGLVVARWASLLRDDGTSD